MATKKQKLDAIKKVLEDYEAEQVSALAVYKDIFRLGEGVLEKEGESSGEFKTNPIGYGYNYKRDEKGKLIHKKNKDGSLSADYEREKGRHIIMYEDTFEKNLKVLQKYDFAILNGLSYFGWRNFLRSANKMHALILDLDGISDKGMNNFLGGCKAGVYPLPNYIVLSGTNCHLYYVFEAPIPLFPDLKLALKEFKYSLTKWIWNKNVSDEEMQSQGINQGFRVVGGKTKPNSPIRRTLAYKLNVHPFDLAILNDFVTPSLRVDDSKLFRIGKTPWATASKLYPEWAERVRARSGKFPGRLYLASGQKGHKGDELYEWWLRRLRNAEAIYGSRYFALMSLVIFGVKCGLDYERIKKDSYSLIGTMSALNVEKPFTEYDVECALECYDEDFATFPRKDIEKMSHMPIPSQKRNHRARADHLRRARAVRDIDYPDGSWRNKDGRPDKRELVVDYIKAHPEATPTEISKALGISRPTVYKYRSELE